MLAKEGRFQGSLHINRVYFNKIYRRIFK